VVLVTLVGQGLTFGPLVRAIGLRAEAADAATLRNEARIAAAKAGLARLEELAENEDEGVGEDTVTRLRQSLTIELERAQRRLELLESGDNGEITASPDYEAGIRARRAVLDAQREELLRWRDAGRLPDLSLRVLQRELDHQENALSRGAES
jgi:CPA1 family monovalent cation:H+ antiporter